MSEDADLARVAIGMVTVALQARRGEDVDVTGSFRALAGDVIREDSPQETILRQTTVISATLAYTVAELLMYADRGKAGFADQWLRDVGQGWARG